MDMLGARIGLLRRSLGLRQEDLAQALLVSKSAVGMYEQGRREPSLDRLVVLARLLGVSTDYLLTGRVLCPADAAAAALERPCQTPPPLLK